MKEIVLNSGLKVSEKIILELAEIEMDEGCHDDYIDDYESEMDFYLSNIREDSYTSHFLPYYFDVEEDDDIHYSKEDYENISYLVVEKIEELASEI